jgi:hypothetical protein
MLIFFNKHEVIPEIRPDPSPSHNDIQSMINFVLKRQAKNTDKLLSRWIEEWDGKKHYATSVNSFSSTYVVSFTQTNLHTSGPSTGGTSMPNPSAQPVNHFHRRTTIGKGIRKPHLVFLCQTLPRPRTPPGATAEHIRTLAATTKPHTLP